MILVAGATGNVGIELVRALAGAGKPSARSAAIPATLRYLPGWRPSAVT